MAKILTKQQLKRRVRDLKRLRRRIVTTNGSFDILHDGHVFMLERAKKLGDVLIVGVNSDSSIKKYKGKDRPIIPQASRVKLLASLRCIDYLYVFSETNPTRFLETVRPNIHVNSSEYGKNCVEAPTVRKYGGKLVLIKKQKRLLSTTDIINRILKIYRSRI